MNRDWEDVQFARYGSDEFRKVKFTMWIGYDYNLLHGFNGSSLVQGFLGS